MGNKKQAKILSDYQVAIDAFLNTLAFIDAQNGTYAIITIVDIDITPMGATLHRYSRNINCDSILCCA